MNIETAQSFQAKTKVSDDVLDRLQTYVDLLVKWQAKINLVGPDTLPQVWSRHMLDSAQLAPLIGQDKIKDKIKDNIKNIIKGAGSGPRVADLGSGAGFPGLVLAIMLRDQGIDVHLVESDQRKCSFLREVNRVCQAGATIHTARIEHLDSLQADVVTSRALANLTKLIEFADIHRLSTGKCVFLKGKRWQEELTAAQKSWKIEAIEHPSCTEPAGRVLELLSIERV
ncbi:MAG: 16S rRNA (guanine(527)-N(7))-methyltransferase RsmG [Magnetovibrio sp.]|nr:16S rRNA (guanine(527)-N(7))-methyltransferase RsmG [Magnetovibrio sp.]